MSTRDRRQENDPEVSFEGVVDVGSVPPPASGQVDVHRAPTAVATMTDELMDEIRRARDEARLVEGEKTRVVPKFQFKPAPTDGGFTDEAPTRPGKDKEKDRPLERRPSAPDLHEARSIEPEPVVARDTLPLAPLPPLPIRSLSEPIPIAAPTPRTRRRRLWPRLLFFVITMAALVVSALAVRRYRIRLHR